MQKKNKNKNILDAEIIANEQSQKNIKDDILKEENLEEKYKDYKIIDLKSFHKFLIDVKNFLFGITLEKSQYREENKKQISQQIINPIKFGLLVAGIAFSFFGIWSFLAPLDSASIAEGFIKLSENKKIIQHYEGGIVEEILVKDGMHVKKGDRLIVLNDARTSVDLSKVLWSIRYAIVVDARLKISVDLVDMVSLQQPYDHLELKVDNQYVDFKDDRVLDLLDAQKKLFNSYRSYLISRLDAFNTQIQQAQYEINSYKERMESDAKNLKIQQREYKNRKNLFAKNLETSDRLSQIELEIQRTEGSIAEIKSRIAGAQHKIAEINANTANFLDQERVKLSDDYKKNHTELLMYQSEYIKAKDSHERTVVTAPNSGIVTDLQVHTIGASLSPNAKLMEIVPQDDKMIIEAFIPSHEIDSIKVGGTAKIQLNAYKARLVPRIEGKIIHVSPDKFDKEMPGYGKLTPVGYYKANIEVEPEEIAKINTDVTLFPGMPVTVFLIKGTRTFAEYLYSPFKDSFHRAFKEP